MLTLLPKADSELTARASDDQRAADLASDDTVHLVDGGSRTDPVIAVRG